MHGSGDRTVVVIPGIGGHPRFHQGFLDALGRTQRVHCAPHVDFSGEPCPDWRRHVDHWHGQFERAAAGGPPAVVGISYGAHLGWQLYQRLPAGTMSALVLVSYWPLTGRQRRGLRRLRGLPRLGAATVGTACFRWSERQTADQDRLRALRRELYDDEATVRRRLWARLVSLADAPKPPAASGAPGVGFVYARAEWPLRAMRRSHGGSLPPATVLVAGDHSVSLGGSAELVGAVGTLIGQAATRGDGR